MTAVRRRAASCVAAVITVLALVGCTTGGTDPDVAPSESTPADATGQPSPSETAPPPQPPPTASTPAPTTSDVPSPSETTTVITDVPEPPAIPGRTFQHAAFQSPTGNIGCLASGGSVRCDVLDVAYALPPPPADCQLAYGQAFQVTAGRAAELACVGDTVVDPGAPVLAYGDAVDAGPVTCLSAEDGMRCWLEVEPHHGFRVARSSYEIY